MDDRERERVREDREREDEELREEDVTLGDRLDDRVEEGEGLADDEDDS